MQTQRPKLTILIPAFNEEACLPRVFEEINHAIVSLPCDVEVLLIDNASTDRTGMLAEDFCKKDSRWKYIRFSRNFTVEISLAAGFRYATGDAMMTVYSDLQDPPDKIPDFVAKWLEGYDVVYGTRTRRPGDPAWRNFLIKIAYRIIRWMSDCDLPVDAGDFCLVSRRVRDALVRMDEQNRYTRGLVHWVGFKRCAISYERRPRAGGDSKAPFFSIAAFMLTAITSFSVKPLRMFTLLGTGIIGITVVLMILYIIGRFTQNPPRGITTTLVLLLANLGLMSMGFGILGEYIGRIYTESKKRPLWVIEKSLNIKLDEHVG